MSEGYDFTVEAATSAVKKVLSSQADAAGRVAIDPDRIEQDLARLVLGLMAFIRELMELQAIRRSEAGSLTEDEEERLGVALLRSERAILEMAAKFDLCADDLSLDLGPLGRTI